MSEFTIRQASPPPAKFTRRIRPGGIGAIRQGQIHTTRGNVPENVQVHATENHFAHQQDRGGWGSSADFVIGPDHRINNEIAIVSFGDWGRTFSSWSAGYGADWTTTYGAAEVGVAIEVAQRRATDVIDPRSIDALVWLCRHINEYLEVRDLQPIPVRQLTSWDQSLRDPIAGGYIGHEDLANGKRLGKTDPGPMFPWDDFIRRMGEPDVSPELAVRPLGAPWGLVKEVVTAAAVNIKPLRVDGAYHHYDVGIRRE